MSTEIIIALGTLVASVIGAILASRAQSASLFAELCKGQQARIEQLTKRVQDNDTELACLRAELATAQATILELQGERERREQLEERVAELERENTDLRAQIAALRARKK